MTDLIAFLNARFAEDLELANAVDLLSSEMPRTSTHSLPEFAEYMVRWQPNTIRREIGAKQKLLHRYQCSITTLRMLAEAYSDHPDYNSDWQL